MEASRHQYQNDCACPSSSSSRVVTVEDCALPSLTQLGGFDTEIENFLTVSQVFPALAVIIHLAN